MSAQEDCIINESNESAIEQENSSTVTMLSAGLLEIYEPHLKKIKLSLQELTAKQNKLYIDLSTQRAALSTSDISNVGNMMERAKVYKDKLIRIKKQMANIHHRTQVLKRKAFHIQSCKEKEMASVIQKRLQEEALIGKRSQD